MKILSYKILSEEVLGVGKFKPGGKSTGLVGANMLAKKYNQKVYSNYYFDELLKLHFQILQYQNNQYSIVGNYSVLFAVKREDDSLTLFLHPYSKFKIGDLVRENGQKYASLTLYKSNNPPTKVSWENPNDLKGKYFRFNLNIGDQTYFTKANQLYKFSNLNNMLGLDTNGINPNHIIRFIGVSNYTKLESFNNSSNSTILNGNYDTTILFRNATSQILQPIQSWFASGVNPIIVKYNIVFNNATYSGQKPIGYTNVTSFQKASGEIAYLFTPTSQPLKNNYMQSYKSCHILLPNSTITQTPIEFKINSIIKT
jgi:hypothetical protein